MIPRSLESLDWASFSDRRIMTCVRQRLLGNPGTAAPDSLIVTGFGDSSTGYGNLLVNLMKHLEIQAIPTRLDALGFDQSRRGLDPFLRRRIILGQPPARPRLMVTGHQLGVSPQGSVMFSMWETTRVPAFAVRLYNQAMAMIVPCDDNLRWMRDSGVTVPIHVVPLGVDLSIYRPGPPVQDFHVLSVARVGAGGARKGIEDVLSVWIDALGAREDCRLTVKLWRDCDDINIQHPRVTIDRTCYSDAGMAGLFRSASVYFTMTRGEGWGLPGLEAMACGLPVVAAAHSGMSAYLRPDNAFLVEYGAAPAYPGAGDWHVPNPASAVAKLRQAYQERGESSRRAAALDCAGRHPWAATAIQVAAILRGYGIIRSG